MSLRGKTFINNTNGELIKITESMDGISILDNGTKISNAKLLDSRFYTEQIDPREFLNSSHTSFLNQLKSVDTSNMRDDEFAVTPTNNGFKPSFNESAIIESSEEDEIEILKRKYGATMLDTESLRRQNESFHRIMDEPGSENIPVVQKNNRQVNNTPKVGHNTSNDSYTNESYTNESYTNESYNPPPRYENPNNDPIVGMFKGVKRVKDFNIDFNINKKIPRLDFLEMMEESYEKSLIDFLAEEFTNEILSNPLIIREKISQGIRKLVYPNGVPSVDDSEEGFDLTDDLTDDLTKNEILIDNDDLIKSEGGEI